MINCFNDIYSCYCDSISNEFNQTIKLETNFNISIEKMCHSNIGWFTDKSISNESLLEDWGINNKTGIYFLWHKNGYCDKHDLFHMKCLYVGKGEIIKRIIQHFKTKDFSSEILVYFTYLETSNRIAKYLEQLVLDIYDIPFNKVENIGTQQLCMYFSQIEVD